MHPNFPLIRQNMEMGPQIRGFRSASLPILPETLRVQSLIQGPNEDSPCNIRQEEDIHNSNHVVKGDTGRVLWLPDYNPGYTHELINQKEGFHNL